MNKKLQPFVKEGFYLKEKKENNLAFLSLRIALQAYFSTYHIAKHRFNLDDENDQEIDTIKYCETCSETIVHFQHFFELIIKDVLRQDHLLLGAQVAHHPEVLYKILKKIPLSSEEESKIKSVEFSEAFKILCKLIKSGQIQNVEFISFFETAKITLNQLNMLRNRIWHRGSFFLYYSKLDEFIGKYVLPIVINVIKLPMYKNTIDIWMYKNTKCKIDPIKSICREYKKNIPVNRGKIALFKEIGRAAYKNPLHHMKRVNEKKNKKIDEIDKKIKDFERRGEKIPKRLIMSKKMAKMNHRMVLQFDEPYIERAKKLAKDIAKENFYNIKKCPVCGTTSLVLYDESDVFENDKTGEHQHFFWIYEAKCECCTFEIDSKLKIKDYDLTLENYWTVEEL